MVQFQCPRCKAVLKAPDDMAGQKIECVKCQQRLLVPATAWTGSAAGPPARQIPHTVENDSHQPGISKVVSAIGSFVRGSFYGYLLVFCVVLVAGIVLALLYASGKWTVDFANGKQSEQVRGQSSGSSTSEPEHGRDSSRSPSISIRSNSASGSSSEEHSVTPSSSSSSSGEGELAELMKQLDSDQVQELLKGCKAVGRLKEKGKPASRALASLCLHKSEEVRLAALESLERVNARVHAEILILIADQNPDKHLEAVQKLGNSREETESASPVLIAHCRAMLERRSKGGRETPFRIRAGFLGRFPELAKADVDALARIAADDEKVVELALAIIDDKELDSDDSCIVAACSILRSICKIKAKFKGATVAAVIVMIQDQNRRHALDTWKTSLALLGEIGPDAKSAIPELKKLKLHPDAEMRQEAARVLKLIDPDE